MDWLVGGLCGLVFGGIALFGERIQKALEARRIRRHTCPTPCLESMTCRCGCLGRPHFTGWQFACAVCGEVLDREITVEIAAPRGGDWT